MTSRSAPFVAAAALCLAVGASAQPPVLRGGSPNAAGSTSACGSGGVCALFQNGQAFVTWPDAATGASGNNFRYRMYRSTAPIDAGNYASATLIANYILNNSGQLLGGNPDTGGTTFTQANRQDPAQPMVVLTDLGTPLDDFTGLQVYTATGAGNAYYAIVSTDTSDASPAFIGSVGPIAETVANPAPIKIEDSLSRPDNFYGKINLSLSNVPTVYWAHQSGSTGGCAPNCQYGDYWEWFLTPAEGWWDGRATVLDVLLDKAQNYRQNTLKIAGRDTIWNSLGTGGIETTHQTLGMSPPDGRPASRVYRTTAKGIARMLNWAIGYYGVDPNQLHWEGASMGAWGGANTGMRMTSPKFSAVWVSHPVWRMDLRTSGGWAGLTWSSTMPFRATTAACPDCLGTTASSVLMDDGAVWGGAGGYADMPGFIASNPGTDLPVAVWMISKHDGFGTWAEQITAMDAFESAHRGYAAVWYVGAHDTGSLGLGVINCDWTANDAAVCYPKSVFKLNQAYIATSNSSIDDNPGTATPTANGLFDGDYTGGRNIGFSWNVTSDTAGAFNFTIDNAWMDRSPTVFRTTTLSGSMASSGGGTVAVGSTAGWPTDAYVLIGDDASPSTQEVVTVTSFAGNSLTYTSRGLFGTTAQAHSPGVAVKQLTMKATGPNGGPYSTMTVDLTPRRIQGFTKGTTNGQVVSCDITPDGGSLTTQTPTVANNIFTLTGVTINATGPTSVACD